MRANPFGIRAKLKFKAKNTHKKSKPAELCTYNKILDGCSALMAFKKNSKNKTIHEAFAFMVLRKHRTMVVGMRGWKGVLGYGAAWAIKAPQASPRPPFASPPLPLLGFHFLSKLWREFQGLAAHAPTRACKLISFSQNVRKVY